ncbi:hypothetical protein HX787_21560 [Pseudomonas tolaasii]|uniref:DUF4148 domain-containing protein n=2 Tax=Pseudomonas tolaasii TaxID=29442 RepID=A0A7Y8DSL3_PSETO|nr:hypothetical protein [Pseudomonas tolaasii]ARB26674.1 hypothetical protein B5P22_05090 [Pseudomonas tolaasii]KAB0470564.1 hypothetical protein F7R12_20170 [Pseudomonas tolaasii]MBY8944026.1 hypothetical protein [Pseudomonas tolaasii]NVZ45369.1 hypothetical protein [Pseudomonas tolaasii]NWA48651.1 hypothetical protein [Pseudomonas tolaasii]
MQIIAKTFAVIVLALPVFAHASDGAEAAERFKEQKKATFAQHAKVRADREKRELKVSKELTKNASSASSQREGSSAE